MNTRSDIGIDPRLAIFRTENDVHDDFAKRLRHGLIMDQCALKLNRAFSAQGFFLWKPGALPQAKIELRRWRVTDAR